MKAIFIARFFERAEVGTGGIWRVDSICFPLEPDADLEQQLRILTARFGSEIRRRWPNIDESRLSMFAVRE